MSDRQQFDLLRQTSSAALKQLISAAHETEFQTHMLKVPVTMDAARRFSSQRRAEDDALEAYMVASKHLAAFVHQHVYIVN